MKIEEKIKYPSENCDSSCYYHCTKNGQQEPECVTIKNNGWIRIESENDLPSEEYEYKVGTMIETKFYLSGGVYEKEEVIQSWYSNKITHYQPIQKPQSPIY